MNTLGVEVPKQYIQQEIWRMLVGDMGWIRTSDMYLMTDKDGVHRAWLKTHAIIADAESPMVNGPDMRIERRENGFHVWPPAHHKWSIEMDMLRSVGLPVTGIHDVEENPIDHA